MVLWWELLVLWWEETRKSEALGAEKVTATLPVGREPQNSAAYACLFPPFTMTPPSSVPLLYIQSHGHGRVLLGRGI